MKTLIIYLSLLLSGSPSSDLREKQVRIQNQAFKQIALQQINSQMQLPEALVGTMIPETAMVELRIRTNHEVEVVSIEANNAFTEVQLQKMFSGMKIFIPNQLQERQIKFRLQLKRS